MDLNKIQVGGNHYKKTPIQHWDMAIKFDMDYFQGQITKYVDRWKRKNGIKDLLKAKHFLDKYIESKSGNPVEDKPDNKSLMKLWRALTGTLPRCKSKAGMAHIEAYCSENRFDHFQTQIIRYIVWYNLTGNIENLRQAKSTLATYIRNNDMKLAGENSEEGEATEAYVNQ